MAKVVKTIGYAAQEPSAALQPWSYESKPMGPKDIHIQVKYAGICHSDIHMARNEWSDGIFPMVPGHEIAGVVADVGSEVTKYKKGDRVGVGCLVGSCRECENCKSDLENYCPKLILTYAGKYPDGRVTYGGYGRDVVVDEHFVCRIPEKIELDAAAPLLCAGITTYSPIKFYGMDKPGTKVGVVGLGGLGHMAVQFLKAFGCEVTVFSRTNAKKDEAMKVLKADHFVVSSDEEEMAKAVGTLSFIIDTVAAPKDNVPYLMTLKTNGKIVQVGAPPKGHQITVPPMLLIVGRKGVCGSAIGGMKETQEMLDFCAEHNIKCMIEKIPMTYVNEAYARVVKGDVKYRFVMDVEKTGPAPM